MASGFATGHLAAHPLPPGIVGALSLTGYQLLADVGGVGAGRLGPQAFLLFAPEPPGSGPAFGGTLPGPGEAGPGAETSGSGALTSAPPSPPSPMAPPDLGTQIALHQPRLRSEQEVSDFIQLAAQLGYLRLSGYRLVPERQGLRSRIGVLNPATGAVALQIPDRHPGRLFGGGVTAGRLLAAARSLPAAGAPPDLQSPELLRQVLLALALRDESLGGAEAAELADRALELAHGQPGAPQDPVALLEAARRTALGSG